MTSYRLKKSSMCNEDDQLTNNNSQQIFLPTILKDYFFKIISICPKCITVDPA
jgi:hypothetical protein